MNYTLEQTLDPRNTKENKFSTHKISQRKIFGPSKEPREIVLHTRNTPVKKFRTNKIRTTTE